MPYDQLTIDKIPLVDRSREICEVRRRGKVAATKKGGRHQRWRTKKRWRPQKKVAATKRWRTKKKVADRKKGDPPQGWPNEKRVANQKGGGRKKDGKRLTIGQKTHASTTKSLRSSRRAPDKRPRPMMTRTTTTTPIATTNELPACTTGDHDPHTAEPC